MKWICVDCNWTGSYEELDYYKALPICPLCSGEADIDDRLPDPDPLDEHNADYVRTMDEENNADFLRSEIAALRGTAQ